MDGWGPWDTTPAGLTKIGATGDATSLENMKRSLEVLKNCNERRALEGLSPFTVSDNTMANAQITANMEAHTYDHTQSFYTECYGENAAWGDKDPYVAWVDQEKAVYDEIQANYGGKADEDLTREEKIAIYDKLAAQGQWWETDNDEFKLPWVQTGHYRNWKRANGLTGLGICENGGPSPDDGHTYNPAWTQQFGGSGTAYSVDEYYAQFMDYYNKYMNADEHVAQAERAVAQAQAALDAASGAVTEAESFKATVDQEVATAQQAVTEAQSVVATKTSELESANGIVATKNAELDAAKVTVAEKTAAVAEARRCGTGADRIQERRDRTAR